MASKKTTSLFQTEWLKNPLYCNWLQENAQKKTEAHCELCFKDIDLSNMGKGVLDSHAESAKHKASVASATQSSQIKSFFPAPAPVTSSASSSKQ